MSSKSIHDDDDCDNNNDDFQIHQQYGHSVHQSCQSIMSNILKPKQQGTFYSSCYHTKYHHKNSLTRNGVDATRDHKSSQRSLFLQRQQWGQFRVNMYSRIQQSESSNYYPQEKNPLNAHSAGWNRGESPHQASRSLPPSRSSHPARCRGIRLIDFKYSSPFHLFDVAMIINTQAFFVYLTQL